MFIFAYKYMIDPCVYVLAVVKAFDDSKRINKVVFLQPVDESIFLPVEPTIALFV